MDSRHTYDLCHSRSFLGVNRMRANSRATLAGPTTYLSDTCQQHSFRGWGARQWADCNESHQQSTEPVHRTSRMSLRRIDPAAQDLSVVRFHLESRRPSRSLWHCALSRPMLSRKKRSRRRQYFRLREHWRQRAGDRLTESLPCPRDCRIGECRSGKPSRASQF
jgi:hypothetical protein